MDRIGLARQTVWLFSIIFAVATAVVADSETAQAQEPSPSASETSDNDDATVTASAGTTAEGAKDVVQRGFSYHLSQFLRLLVLTRYPVILGALLATLGPLTLLVPAVRQISGNVILVHHWRHTLCLTSLSILAASLLLAEFQVLKYNAARRFPDISKTTSQEAKPADSPTSQPVDRAFWKKVWNGSPLATGIWLLLSFSLPICSLVHSYASRDRRHGGQAMWLIGLLVGAAIGIALAGGVLWMLSYVNARIGGPEASSVNCLPFDQIVQAPSAEPIPMILQVDRMLASMLAGPGYVVEENVDGSPVKYMAPGHWQMIIAVGFLLLVYAAGFVFQRVTNLIPSPRNAMPVSCYVLVIMMIASGVMGGASFFFDFYRVPAVLAVFGLLTLTYRIFAKTHVFPVRHGDASRSNDDESAGDAAAGSGKSSTSEVATPPDLIELFEGFGPDRFPAINGKRTMVVVTAPGGGIHAAAWTVRVLSGLHDLCGPEFSRSIGMISAVSGGSVGLLHYLASYAKLCEAASVSESADESSALNARVRESSLEAVGLGLAFPDLVRLTTIFNPRRDRATFQEERWRRILPRNAVRHEMLADLVDPIRNGRLPIPVFNSTEVTTGRRVLMSPVVARPRKSLEKTAAEPVELRHALAQAGADISTITAARLSASFPFVSPIAKPSMHLDGTGPLALADGGYADNEGIVTVVDWLEPLMRHFETRERDQRPFDQVLLLRIAHYPIQSVAQPEPTPQKRGSLLLQLFGPLQAIVSVRSSSQLERGQLEVDLTKERERFASMMWTALKAVHSSSDGEDRLRELGGEQAPLEEFSAPAVHKAAHPIRVDSLFVEFCGAHAQDAPLNWKLSPIQKTWYDNEWEEAKSSGEDTRVGRELKRLFDYFPRRTADDS